MTPDQYLVIAVDHPSLSGTLGVFLGELRAERGCTGRGPPRGRNPFTELIERLGAPKMIRRGVMGDPRQIAPATVGKNGAVAQAVVAEFRRRGIANELVRVATERAEALGYPPLHRFTASRARLAG